MSREHELKCWPEFFTPLLTGAKTFELRKNDRGFQVGDVLWLREWDAGDPGQGFGYTGREMRRRVTYILIGMGIEREYACLGLSQPSWEVATSDPARLTPVESPQAIGSATENQIKVATDAPAGDA
jgi:hypothetical protein